MWTLNLVESLTYTHYLSPLQVHLTGHPLFQKMVHALKTSPPTYEPPERHRMHGSLLDSVVADLRLDEAPLRDSILRKGGTILSDGWDAIDRSHLINLLEGNVGGIFFDGTVEVTSDSSEDATSVAALLKSFAERTGKLSIIQVCTDTCAVMQASWKILQVELP